MPESHLLNDNEEKVYQHVCLLITLYEVIKKDCLTL
jgi:hypothetical protein